MTGRDALLQVFDRLFETAANKMSVSCTPEVRADAKAVFTQHFHQGLELASRVEVSKLPEEVVEEMVTAVEQLKPAEIAGVVASVPLAQWIQEMTRTLAVQQAERRLLEHLVMQADTRYGGS